MKYKKGDKVKVYSLQSFSDGGFINGTEGVIFQDQIDNGSVIVSVERNFKGTYKIDKYYEVYPEQLRLISRKLDSKIDSKIDSRFEILDL